jgi:hypothetical protein
MPPFSPWGDRLTQQLEIGPDTVHQNTFEAVLHHADSWRTESHQQVPYHSEVSSIARR